MDPLPPCESGDPAIAGLVAQMLQTTASLTVMVDEMMRFQAAGRSAPDAPPVIEVLGSLLRDVLSGLLTEHSRMTIESATTILREADAIMCRDLYFVSPEATASRERRPGTPRTRRRR